MLNRDNKIITVIKPYGKKINKKFFRKDNYIMTYSSLGEFCLSELEYKICMIINDTNTYEDTFNKAIDLKLVKNEAQFKDVIEKFIDNKILIEVDMSNDSIFMNNVIIKRNGKGLGRDEDGKWMVGACHSDKSVNGTIHLTGREEYRVWMCANGTSRVKDVLGRIGTRMNFQEGEDVIVLLKKHFYNFVNLGIWELDYCKDENGIESASTADDMAIFDLSNLREDSLLIPVGYEMGKLNLSKKEFWISRGSEWITLDDNEYKLWNALNKKVMKLTQIQFEYGMTKDEIVEEIIAPMMERKLILLWDSALLSKTKIVRVSSQGKNIESANESLSCQFKSVVDIGYIPEVSEFSHKLWMVVSGDKTIREIVNEMKAWDKNTATYEETQERVVENIRALMSLGLIKIDVL